MDMASIFYLGVTFTLFLVFVAIVLRTYSSKRRDIEEAPKHRMMEE